MKPRRGGYAYRLEHGQPLPFEGAGQCVFVRPITGGPGLCGLVGVHGEPGLFAEGGEVLGLEEAVQGLADDPHGEVTACEQRSLEPFASRPDVGERDSAARRARRCDRLQRPADGLSREVDRDALPDPERWRVPRKTRFGELAFKVVALEIDGHEPHLFRERRGVRAGYPARLSACVLG